MADGGKGKQLRADIVIGGKLDGSFSALGAAIQSLGGQVSQVSDRLISFGKESVGEYVKFEDAMLDARVAMKTQYDSTNQLDKDMKSLTEHALQWASSTRFTTDDVASSISNAAHAGWEYEQILEGIPNAMEVAMAGGMDLSKSVDYMVKITNAAGLSFEELGTFTDMWTYAANSSATTIPEMGDAMVKMGASMQFVKGDMVGLTTMLATLADQGTVGEQAGTLLRNSLFRLIAPTEKAAKAMDGFKLTEEELNEIYGENNENTEKVVNHLKELGFSVYDAQGNLKPFLEIFEDLEAVTSKMTEEERYQALAAIFPTKTLAGALALINGARNGWNGLDEAIRNASEGYGEFAMETMESGLGGALRRLDSAWQALETRVGGSLKDDVGTVAGFLTDVVNSVNNMDPTVFDAIVGGLEVVAAAGPGLLIAGGAIKGLGMIAATGAGGQLVLAGIGLAAVAKGLSEVREAVYENQFGEMSLDQDAMYNYVKGFGDAFKESDESIEKYNTAMEKAISNYTTASSTFNENIMTLMLTKATLTDEDVAKLNGLGDTMYNEVINGINAAYSKNEEILAQFAGVDDPTQLVGSGDMWGQIMSVINIGYDAAIADAKQKSKELRDAMTSAFADGNISADEAKNLQNMMREQQEMLAMQTDAENAAKRAREMRKASTLGLEGLGQIDEIVGKYTSEAEENDLNNYESLYYQTLFAGQYMIEKGMKKEDGTPYTQADLDADLEWLRTGDPNNPNDGYEGTRLSRRAEASQMTYDMYDAAIAGSDIANAWDALGTLADGILSTGGIMTKEMMDQYFASDLTGDGFLNDIINQMVTSLGGDQTVKDMAAWYAANGDMENAQKMNRLMAMADALDVVYNAKENGLDGMVTPVENNVPELMNGVTAQDMFSEFVGMDSTGMAQQFFDELGYAMESGATDSFDTMFQNMQGTNMMDQINAFVNNMSSMFDLSQFDVSNMSGQYQQYAQAYAAAMSEQPITAQIDGDPTGADEAIQGLDGQTVTADVQGNVNPARDAINSLNGMSVTVKVNANVSGLSASGLNTRGSKMTGGTNVFALGGRANEPSIFGEAGPEWAIPEQHTERTAELLSKAAAASGFSWSELLSRNGGLNAGEGRESTLVYSPVIYANDATDVEAKLREDKERLEKWYRDMQIRDSVEAYA